MRLCYAAAQIKQKPALSPQRGPIRAKTPYLHVVGAAGSGALLHGRPQRQAQAARAALCFREAAEVPAQPAQQVTVRFSTHYKVRRVPLAVLITVQKAFCCHSDYSAEGLLLSQQSQCRKPPVVTAQVASCWARAVGNPKRFCPPAKAEIASPDP